MSRFVVQTVAGSIARAGRWRRLMAALGATAAVALVIGIILGADLPGSSKGASNAAQGSGVATVQRRDLVSTDTESGTLSYSDPQTVYNRVSGTVTWLPQVGRMVKPGHTLYKVDNAPVALFNGSVPAYRDLYDGVSDGPDVKVSGATVRRTPYVPEEQTGGIGIDATDPGLLKAVGGELAAGSFIDQSNENFPTVVLGAQAASTMQIQSLNGHIQVFLGGTWSAGPPTRWRRGRRPGH